MLRTRLDNHCWCIVRAIGADGEPVRSEGTHGLESALRIAAAYLDDGRARRVVVFDGQPADGAKRVVLIDLDGNT